MNAGSVKPRLALFVAEYAYFVSHRLPLAQAAVADGYEVTVYTRVPEGMRVPDWPGIHVENLPIRRSARNPFADLAVVLALAVRLRRLRPDILHNVSLKLALLGSLAARAAGVRTVVNAFTGLGYSFRSDNLSAAMLRFVITPLFAAAARRPGTWSLFQNESDRDECLRRGIAVAERTALIPGSGVDIAQFRPAPEPEGMPCVLFAGRLVLDKGIGEFVEAARLLKSRGVHARFVAIGERDSENPRCVPERTLKSWRDENLMEFPGQQSDMQRAYHECHLVCLPSYHEGMPKVVLEAAACARPVVATDIPGCRAAVEPGVSGLLVPVRDPVALADALEKLIADRELRAKMGASARQQAEQRFAVGIINRQILDLYSRMAAG